MPCEAVSHFQCLDPSQVFVRGCSGMDINVEDSVGMCCVTESVLGRCRQEPHQKQPRSHLKASHVRPAVTFPQEANKQTTIKTTLTRTSLESGSSYYSRVESQEDQKCGIKEKAALGCLQRGSHQSWPLGRWSQDPGE